MRIGNQEREVLLPTSSLVEKITLTSDASHVRSMIGKRPITNENHLAAMEGKSYFLSHAIPGVDIRQRPRLAYRFHRLTGGVAKDAAIIHDAMMEARLGMLEWLLRHVNAPEYLDCAPGFFDYATPVRELAASISRYPGTPLPKGG